MLLCVRVWIWMHQRGDLMMHLYLCILVNDVIESFLLFPFSQTSQTKTAIAGSFIHSSLVVVRLIGRYNIDTLYNHDEP